VCETGKAGKTMNLIPMIAKELGVEVGEKFKVTGYGGTYSFKENGLCYYDKQRKEWTLAEDYVLVDILRGVEEIEKLPFEPKEGEKYFVVSIVGKSVCHYLWDGTTTDYCFKACGNCFRTEKEAEAHKYEIYEKLTGKKWEEKCDT
jgi:hypothetical protein